MTDYIVYRGVPLVTITDLTIYGWRVNRMHSSIPIVFLLPSKKPGPAIGYAEVYTDSDVVVADLFIDDTQSSWHLKEYRLSAIINRKVIDMVALVTDKAHDYNFPIGNYSSAGPKCSCGAEHTSTPQFHLWFCNKYKG